MAIYGSIKDLYVQCAFSKNLKLGLDYLSDFDPSSFDGKPEGFFEKIIILGKSVYAINQVYATKPVSEAKFEVHKKYIDLQVVWKGEEIIPVYCASGLSALTLYDSKKDIQFFKFCKSAVFVMKPGVAAVLYPCDAHAPCISNGRKSIIAKTVVKVRV